MAITKDDIRDVLKEYGVITEKGLGKVLKSYGVVTEKNLGKALKNYGVATKRDLNKVKRELQASIANVAFSSPTSSQFNQLEKRVASLS